MAKDKQGGEQTPPQVARERENVERSKVANLAPRDYSIEAFDNWLEGGGEPAPPLPADTAKPAASPAPFDTETLLNELIVECRTLLRDVAFRSACLTPDADDRIRFISAAQNLAITGANVGKVVARLRTRGARPVDEHRHHMIYEHVQTPPSPRGNVP